MATLQPFQCDLVCFHILRCFFAAIFFHGAHINSSGTSDTKFTFVFRVEIHEDLPFKKSLFKSENACHSCFFINCEKAFNGAMGNIRRCQHRHGSGHPDSVVRAKRCPIRLYPVAINYSLNRVLLKVVLLIPVLLGNHIKVSLQNDPFPVFHSFGGRFADDHITYLVDHCFEIILFPEILHEFNDFLFFF